MFIDLIDGVKLSTDMDLTDTMLLKVKTLQEIFIIRRYNEEVNLTKFGKRYKITVLEADEEFSVLVIMPLLKSIHKLRRVILKDGESRGSIIVMTTESMVSYIKYVAFVYLNVLSDEKYSSLLDIIGEKSSRWKGGQLSEDTISIMKMIVKREIWAIRRNLEKYGPCFMIADSNLIKAQAQAIALQQGNPTKP